MIACELFRRHVGALVDGELDPTTQIEFERHLEGCSACADFLAFETSYRGYVREALAVPPAPARLHARVLDNLRRVEPEADDVVRVVPLRLRYALPLAGAAALALVVGAAVNEEGDVEQAGVAALEDVVRLQSARLPADVSVEPRPNDAAPVQRVSSYFQGKVEFPVRPAEFANRDVRLVGARLSNVRERRAAALYYELRGGQRLTVVVTDANVAEGVEGAGRQGVIVRDVRGYPVGVRIHGGLTYAFTGDVDRETLARLAASARVRY